MDWMKSSDVVFRVQWVVCCCLLCEWCCVSCVSRPLVLSFDARRVRRLCVVEVVEAELLVLSLSSYLCEACWAIVRAATVAAVSARGVRAGGSLAVGCALLSPLIRRCLCCR